MRRAEVSEIGGVNPLTGVRTPASVLGMETFTLTDTTSGQSWRYDSEAQLKTVARLYAASHPKSSLSVTIHGQTHVIRKAK